MNIYNTIKHTTTTFHTTFKCETGNLDCNIMQVDYKHANSDVYKKNWQNVI